MVVQRRVEQEDLLRQAHEEMLKERARLIAELGDPEEAFDRMAEDLFGTPEASNELLRIVLEDIYGEGFDEESHESGE